MPRQLRSVRPPPISTNYLSTTARPGLIFPESIASFASPRLKFETINLQTAANLRPIVAKRGSNDQRVSRSNFADRASPPSLSGGGEARARRSRDPRHQQRPGDDVVQHWRRGDDRRRTDAARLLSRLERLLQRQEDGRERLSRSGTLAARPPFDPRPSDWKGHEAARPGECHASAPSRDAGASYPQYGRSPGHGRDASPTRAVLDSRRGPSPAAAAIRRLIFLVTVGSRAANLRARR